MTDLTPEGLTECAREIVDDFLPLRHRLEQRIVVAFTALVVEARRAQREADQQILVHGVSLPIVGAAIHELLHTRANGQCAEPFEQCSDAHRAEDIVAATSVLGHAIAAIRAQEETP